MHIVFRYDLIRLSAYQRNLLYDNRIRIVQDDHHTLFAFPEVGYFNYALMNRPELLNGDLSDKIPDFYRQQQTTHFKLLLRDSPFQDAGERKKPAGYELQNILQVIRYDRDQRTPESAIQGVTFRRVTHDTIRKFTEVYLLSFGAMGRDPVRVASNFIQLLAEPGLSLYFIIEKDNIAGVCLLFREGHDYFLSGGAVLPEYRFRNLHKSAIAWRIGLCREDELCGAIYSWAYDGTISLANMKKMGFITAETWRVYGYNGQAD